MTEKGQIRIDAQNIFPIIKKWLYSEKDIFLRELVSNGIDAITKLRILANEGRLDMPDEEFRVDVNFDEEKKTLTIEDNGLGMTAEEVKKYIAQIAFSGAEEFIKLYQANDGGIIGHFGLGFYSAFMVSEKVAIESKSWADNTPAVRWVCDGSPEYEIEEIEKEERGTRIILSLLDEEKEYLDRIRLNEILKKFCSYMPFSIYLGSERINPSEPIWTTAVSELKDEDYIEFYKKNYPMERDPEFWVHINADYPFNLQGILYFPSMDRPEEIKSDKLNLYCNRVFVSSEMNALLPETLNYVRGFLDSPDIPLNVSRSFLQSDARVRKISSFIMRKIADRLVELRTEDEEKYTEMWKRINPFIKIAALRDDKFAQRVEEGIVFETSDGKMTSLEELLKKTYGDEWREDKETQHTVFYAVPGETIGSLSRLYEKSGKTVINGTPPVDSHFFYHTELKKAENKIDFKRIDSELSDVVKDDVEEKEDENGKKPSEEIVETFKEVLSEVEFEAAYLKTDEIPLVLVFPELERRFREMTSHTVGTGDQLWGHKAIINMNHTLVKRMLAGSENPLDSEQMGLVVKHIYQMATLPHRKMDPQTLDELYISSGSLLSLI
ncbi:MAG: molecular chaperone HtpG [Deltaproteobacteria bacterium]|nr:molecular chaperone HtpG [Deltaproteobacteria bacterium]